MRTLLLAVLLLALTAPAAGAATLVFTPSGCTGMPLCGPELINLHAAAGEVNRVSSAPGDAGSIIIRDDGAVITGDCERLDDHARRCPAGLFTATRRTGPSEAPTGLASRSRADPARTLWSLRRRARVRVRVPAGGGPYEIKLRRGGAGALRWRVPALR